MWSEARSIFQFLSHVNQNGTNNCCSTSTGKLHNLLRQPSWPTFAQQHSQPSKRSSPEGPHHQLDRWKPRSAFPFTTSQVIRACLCLLPSWQWVGVTRAGRKIRKHPLLFTVHLLTINASYTFLWLPNDQNDSSLSVLSSTVGNWSDGGPFVHERCSGLGSEPVYIPRWEALAVWQQRDGGGPTLTLAR